LSKQFDKISKFLSYVLRHKPETIEIILDSDGWVNIDSLITQANQYGEYLTKELLEQVVNTNDKSGDPKVYFHDYGYSGEIPIWDKRYYLDNFSAWLESAKEESAQYRADHN